MDTNNAHKHFSAACFNKTWDYIDKKERNEEDQEMMILNAMASLFHWKQREDCTSQNLSISYWQIAKVYGLNKNIQEAKSYAYKCLKVSENGQVPPFYLAYAYEVLSHSYLQNNESEKAKEYLKNAYSESEKITIEEHKDMLIKDLEILKKQLA